jgi:hypothetical protein
MTDEWKDTEKRLIDSIDYDVTWLPAKIRCKQIMENAQKYYSVATKTREDCKAHIVISNQHKRINVMLISENLGLSVDFTPDELREFAATALAAADEAGSLSQTP